MANKSEKTVKKGPVFIIEKEGKAYFKDKKILLFGVKYNKETSPKYPNYKYSLDYAETPKRRDWFKRIINLMMVNKGEIKFVGLTLDEFNNLGGTPLHIDGIEIIDANTLKRRNGGNI